MMIDRRTGRQVAVGDVLIRKDYKGFKHKYEVLEIGADEVRVRKLTRSDNWVYLTMKPAALQLDRVML